MPGLTKLFVIVLVIAAVWYALRLVNRRAETTPSAQPRPKKPMIEAEDLTACRACGTYLPVSAPNCGKPGCPLPR